MVEPRSRSPAVHSTHPFCPPGDGTPFKSGELFPSVPLPIRGGLRIRRPDRALDEQTAPPPRQVMCRELEYVLAPGAEEALKVTLSLTLTSHFSPLTLALTIRPSP